uniref:MFS domain-containing protein n=1 Tax=Caenorhabditis japonica TaxID=281687 RepID=A0A8R1E1L0_CAEJA
MVKDFILKGPSPVTVSPSSPASPISSSAWTTSATGSAHFSRENSQQHKEQNDQQCSTASSASFSCSAASSSSRGEKEQDLGRQENKSNISKTMGTMLENGNGNGNQSMLIMEKQEKIEPRVFKKRWLILVIFMFLSGSNGAQWIQYSIIANIIVDYYHVSWLLDKWGLRLSVLLGALGNCVGAWIKLMSTHPDSFWVTFIGQTIVGASQMFTLGIPPRLAAVWFGPDEVSRACALGVFGNQLGIAVGFVLPPMIVSNGTVEHVTYDLNTLFLGSAVLNTVILALVLCFFTARPSVPPSLAQVTAQEEKTFDNNFWATLKKLMTSRDFVILFITYGINTGVFYAISTLLSQMVLSVYPTETVAVGQVGLVIVVAGMAGSVAGGIMLDKFKKFKLTTILIYMFSFIGMLSFTLTIDLDSMTLVFVNAALLGFFMTGYLPIGFEFAAEITYPAAEGTTSGLLNASAQIFGIALTWLMGIVMHSFGTMTSNIIMSSCLICGTFLTCFIREDLKRQRAHSVQAQIPTSDTQLTSCTLTQNEHF